MGIVNELVKKARIHQQVARQYRKEAKAGLATVAQYQHWFSMELAHKSQRTAYMQAAKMVKADLIMREEVLR